MDEQNITGDENVQARSEGDMTAAIGDEAIAAVGDVLKAGRDIVINQYIQTSNSETSETDEISDDNDIIDQTAKEDASKQGEIDERRSQTPNNKFDFVTSTKQNPYLPEEFDVDLNAPHRFLVQEDSNRGVHWLFCGLLLILNLGYALTLYDDYPQSIEIKRFYLLSQFLDGDNTLIGVTLLTPIVTLSYAACMVLATNQKLELADLVIKATKIPATDDDLGRKGKLHVFFASLGITFMFSYLLIPFLPVVCMIFSLSYIISSRINQMGMLNFFNIVFIINLINVSVWLNSMILGVLWVWAWWLAFAIPGILMLSVGLMAIIFEIKGEELDFTSHEEYIFSRKNIKIMNEIFNNDRWKKDLPYVDSEDLIRSYSKFVRYGLILGVKVEDIVGLKKTNQTFKSVISEIEKAMLNRKILTKKLLVYTLALLSLFPAAKYSLIQINLKLIPRTENSKNYLRQLLSDINTMADVSYLNNSIFSFTEVKSEHFSLIINPIYSWHNDGLSLYPDTPHSLIRMYDLRRNLIDKSKGIELYSDIKGLEEFAERVLQTE